jgi:hypothetical protein
MGWLAATHPELTTRYEQLYSRSAYAPKAYQDEICGRVRELAEAAGIGKPSSSDRTPRRSRRQAAATQPVEPDQLSLLPI